MAQDHVQSRKLQLNWVPGGDGSSPVRYFTLQTRELPNGDWLTHSSAISHNYTSWEVDRWAHFSTPQSRKQQYGFTQRLPSDDPHRVDSCRFPLLHSHMCSPAGSDIKCVGAFFQCSNLWYSIQFERVRNNQYLGLRALQLFAYELCRIRSHDYMGSRIVFYMHSEGHLILIMMSPLSQLKTLSAISFWVLF